MAANDAEMPDHQALSEDIQEMAKHLATLRQEIEAIAGSIKHTGQHQLDRVQDKASEAVSAVEAAVRRDPVTSLGIALGVGLLLGIVLRR